jgi:hypothetical protein
MATPPVPLSKPDLEAHEKATRLEFHEVVRELISIFGDRLVAYMAGVKEPRAVREWAEGVREVRQVEVVGPRLRLALRVALMLMSRDSRTVVQAWFQGNNPQLADRVPLRMIRQGDNEEVGPDILAAARTFLAGA